MSYVSVKLDFSEVAYCAYFWQVIVMPKANELYRILDVKGGTLRKPELHVCAYQKLVKDLVSEKKELPKTTKGAATLFQEISSFVFAPFAPPLFPHTYKKPATYEEAPYLYNHPDEDPTYHNIDAAYLVRPPGDLEIGNTIDTMQTLLSVDETGKNIFLEGSPDKDDIRLSLLFKLAK